MGKRPAILLFPGDWVQDNVAGCSLAAQGLWLRMMFIGHTSERYGYLQQNGKPIPPESIARRCGCTPEQYSSLLLELDNAGIPSRTPEGTIFSRRMVRDANERANHNHRQVKYMRTKKLNDGENDAQMTPIEYEDVNVVLTSPEVKPQKPKKQEFILPDWVPREAWEGFEEMRRKISKPMTERARNMAVGKLAELKSDGHSPEMVLNQSVMHDWPGLYPVKGRGNGGINQRDINDIMRA